MQFAAASLFVFSVLFVASSANAEENVILMISPDSHLQPDPSPDEPDIVIMEEEGTPPMSLFMVVFSTLMWGLLTSLVERVVALALFAVARETGRLHGGTPKLAERTFEGACPLVGFAFLISSKKFLLERRQPPPEAVHEERNTPRLLSTVLASIIAYAVNAALGASCSLLGAVDGSRQRTSSGDWMMLFAIVTRVCITAAMGDGEELQKVNARRLAKNREVTAACGKADAVTDCVCCFERPADVVFIHCGHLTYCMECHDRVLDTQQQEGHFCESDVATELHSDGWARCPLCRRESEAVDLLEFRGHVFGQ